MTTRSTRVVERGAAAFYRALLYFYPRAFRAEHGEAAAALFAEACRLDWLRAGARPVLRRFVAALVTVPTSGLAESRVRQSAMIPPAPAGPALWADIRHAMRALRRNAGLSLSVIATLAIGLGVNTAAFSVLDATLLRPLPYTHAGRAVWLEAAPLTGRPINAKLSWARGWVRASTSIERIEAHGWRSVLVTGAGGATHERLLESTPGYLESVKARPLQGRLLLPSDAQPGAAPVVVISQGFWRERYGAPTDVAGRRVKIDGADYQIVGVASDIPSDIPGLRFRFAAPMIEGAIGGGVQLPVVAWLKPGVSFAQAAAEIGTLPAVIDNDRELRATLTPPRNIFWSILEFRTIVLGVTAAGLLLLLIAGVNVANLLLAAGQTRAGDLALRHALGASRFRLVRLQLIEATTLALIGTGLGLALAWAAVRGLAAVSAGPQFQAPLDSIRIDPVIAAYAVGMALVTAVVFGLAPALRGARAGSDLRHAGGRMSSTRRGPSILVAVETGLAAVLLVAAGVVAHAFLSMHFTGRGFDADRVLGVRIALPPAKYPTAASRAAFFDALRNDVSRLASVEQTGLGYGAIAPADFTAEGDLARAGAPSPSRVVAATSYVAPGYFALMGIPLEQGRGLTAADVAASGNGVQPVVISRSLAENFWPNENAVGATFQIADKRGAKRYEIVGVAGDVSVWGLLSPTCRNCDPQLYLPIPEQRRFTDVLLRVRPGAALPAAALQAAITRLDPDVPSDEELHSGEAGLSDFIRRPRFIAVIFSAFAALAMLLVAVGLSAVVSHSVAQRTREMGIRMALGAHRTSVLRLVIGQGLRPAVIGLVAGLGAAAMLTRFMRSLLYGMSPADPITLVTAPVLLLAIAVAALLVPAMRATRVDPAKVLKAD